MSGLHNMKNIYLTIICLVTLASGCSEETENARTYDGKSLDASKATSTSLALIVNDGKEPAPILNTQEVDLKVAIAPESLKQFNVSESDTVKMTLTHFLGDDLVNQKMEAEGVSTTFKVKLGMGKNRLEISASVVDRPDLTGILEVVQFFDNENPLIVSEAKISTDLATGKKLVEGAFIVTDGSDVSCSEVKLLSNTTDKELLLKVEKSSEVDSNGGVRFIIPKIELLDEFGDNLRLKIVCNDAALNLTEIEDPISREKLDYEVALEIDTHELIGSDDGKKFLLIGEKDTTVKLSLLDKNSGSRVDESVFEDEKPLLSVYTHTSQLDLGMTDKLSRTPFDSNVNLGLQLSANDPEKPIHIAVVKTNVLEGSKEIIFQTEMMTYSDSEGLKATWKSSDRTTATSLKTSSRFFPPLKDEMIPFEFTVTGEGAPLVSATIETGEFEVKDQGNGNAKAGHEVVWTLLEMDPIVPSINEPTTFSFTYPDNVEKNVRLRIKLEDAAGNITYSELSPSFVASDIVRPDFESKRDGAVNLSADCATTSELSVQKLTSFLCRNPLNPDEVMQPVLLQNSGGEGITTFGDQGFVSYTILVDGTPTESSSFEVNTAKPFPSGAEKIMFVPINKSLFEDDKAVSIHFDRESTGATSINNRCREVDPSNDDTYPNVLITNQKLEHLFDCNVSR